MAVDSDMKIEHLPLTEIYSDSTFNIRGAIHMGDVVELAKNINARGLLQAIAVQPYDKMPGFKWRIVLGHRRFAAHQHLQRETIPCVVKYGLSDIDAMAANFNENINRKDLNILEEAYGVKRFADNKLTVDQIAKLVNKGKNWVRIRQALLLMPEPIQQDAAAEFLTQGQILDLSTIGDPDEQMRIVRKIKEAKLNGEKRLPKVKEKHRDPTKLKRRQPNEIYEMVNHIIDETGEGSVATRALAWTNGEISDLDWYRDLIDFYAEKGIVYLPPLEVRHLITVKKGG